MVSVDPFLTIGIDAANLRQGGGVTYLVELLRHVRPKDHGVGKVVVWSGSKTLSAIEDRPWLEKINPTSLDKGLLRRSWWQRYHLGNDVRSAGCHVLFEPGGNCASCFRPVVTMSQNMLPFEWGELRRYGCSFLAAKLLILRLVQSRSFRRADGMIFLTQYAWRGVTRVTGPLAGDLAVIPHGISPRFLISPKKQRRITECDSNKPINLLYVSIIDRYKHQTIVAEAVALLRREGVPVVLHLIGPAYPPALRQLELTLKRLDPEQAWVHYHGAIPFADLHRYYAQADIGIFASSCENLPNILLETMAAGLPVVCSNRGPMPEVLGDAGEYFDPEQSQDLARALRKLIESPQLRSTLALSSSAVASTYSWETCAEKTFDFLVQTALKHRGLICRA